MAIYGNTMSFGGGGQNDTLPPLLDNFRANKNEKKFIMSEHHGGNFTLFKDLPDNTTIKLTSQSNFNLFVCKGKTEAYPTLVLAGSFLEGLKFENDNSVDFQNADIIQYINGLSPEWWKSSSSNTTKPDYANSPHWLSELGFYESNRSLFEKSFLPVELNGVNYGGNRVIVPTLTIRDNYPTWKNLYIWNTGEFGCVSDDGGSVMSYGMGSGGGANREVKAPESPNLQTYFWHIFLEPNPELKVYQNSKGEYFLFDESVEITLSADKMQESRATDLAGAVWVYGDHIPKNVNDGTKIELAREDLIQPQTVLFKDIPDGSTIHFSKNGAISATVTYGDTPEMNHRIVFDSGEWKKKEFVLENDSMHSNIHFSDIDQWLNSTKESSWWKPAPPTGRQTNTKIADYSSEQGFLYQLRITDEILAQNFNDININSTDKAKVGIPWVVNYSETIPYTFFNNISMSDFGEYGYLYGNAGESVAKYDKSQIYAPTPIAIYEFTGKIHPMMEPKPDSKFIYDADKNIYYFESLVSGQVVYTVQWDKSKNFYARQFTYNPKKQYQTMTEGGLTSLNPNEFTNPRKVYEYGSVAPEDKNLIWIQPDGLAKFWNGSEWVAIAGVYAEKEG